MKDITDYLLSKTPEYLYTFFIAFLILISLIKLINQISIINHKIKNKKISKFINFIKKDKNKKNRLYSENIFLYMYNYYIEYEMLIKLIKLKNPTGAILMYIRSNHLLNFNDGRLIFKNKYLNNNIYRNAYYWLFILLGSIFFIVTFLLIIFILVNYTHKNLKDIIYYTIVCLVIFMGFIVSVNDARKMKDAERLIEVFNNKIKKKRK